MSKKRRKRAALAAVLLLLSVGSAFAAGEGKDSQDGSRYPADNTGKNVRDRDDATLTPENQSENKRDRQLTQDVRRSLQRDGGLSVNAKNVKVITVGGQVTLRGPVNSDEERMKVTDTAKRIAGAQNVIDQLEVARPTAKEPEEQTQ